MPSLTFSPINSRVEWARYRLAELERRVETFMTSEPYKVKKKSEPHKLAYYVTEAPTEHPVEISLITGDVLFNLRSALDHLAYQLVVANGVSDEQILRNTYFPIFDSASDCSEKLRKKTPGMSNEARDALRDIKPYRGACDLLWQLHRLNNRDKHRMLITVGAALGFHSLPAEVNRNLIDGLNHAHLNNEISDWTDVFGSRLPSDIVGIRVKPSLRKCPLSVGDELTLAFDDPSLNPEAELDFSFEIAFSEPGIVESESVVGTLKAMVSTVEGVIAEMKHHLQFTSL